MCDISFSKKAWDHRWIPACTGVGTRMLISICFQYCFYPLPSICANPVLFKTKLYKLLKYCCTTFCPSVNITGNWQKRQMNRKLKHFTTSKKMLFIGAMWFIVQFTIILKSKYKKYCYEFHYLKFIFTLFLCVALYFYLNNVIS